MRRDWRAKKISRQTRVWRDFYVFIRYASLFLAARIRGKVPPRSVLPCKKEGRLFLLGVLRAVALPRERSGAIRGDEEMEPWIENKKKLTAAVLGAMTAGLWCHPALAAGNDGDLAVYDIGEITVEAKRPDWEEKLSPGTVTVIRPEEFKGEQKTLPDFLQMVPGVHVR